MAAEAAPGPEKLSAILPTPLQTLLLRASLQSGQSGHEAWQSWCTRVGDPFEALRNDGSDIRGLLPLLSSALPRNGIEPGRPLLTYLRAAYVWERLRSRAYRRICASALSVLADEGIPAIVLGGAALAETAYREPALRHCDDIDLLLRGEDVARAARVLTQHGFAHTPAPLPVTLVHESGLSLQLHNRPFRLPHYDVPFDDLWARGRTEQIAGVPVRIPSSAEHLLHLCGHASYSQSRSSLRWVCDAWSLVDCDPGLDWDLVLACAVRARLALPASLALGYLARELEAPVPSSILDGLRRAATLRTGSAEAAE